MAEAILERILDHLEFLGFEVERKEGFAAARHARRYNMIISEYSWGILFRIYFGTTDQAKRNKAPVYEAANAFNCAAAVCRCYLDKDFDFAFEAVYPKVYDRAVFGTFVDTIAEDLSKLGNADIDISQFVS